VTRCTCVLSSGIVEIPHEISQEVDSKGGFEHIASRIPDGQIEFMSKILSAAANPKRLKILHALSTQRMCVCMLANLIDCSYPKCSYHIANLKNAGLIEAENLGNYIIYSMTPFGRKLVAYLFENMPDEVKSND